MIVFIFLVCFQYGCITNKHKYRAYQDMKDFVLNKDSSWMGYLLFFHTKDKNIIAYQPVYNLQSEFHDSSKFKEVDIDTYFKNIMMGKITLSCKDLTECFTISPVITDEYRRKSLEEFLYKYAMSDTENSRYIIDPSLSYDEKLSIAYYLYLNNIYTIIDDYTGYFISRKNLFYAPIESEWENLEEVKE